MRQQHFDETRTELEGLKVLAEQHLDRVLTLDKEFITAVLHPLLSVRKVCALARKQAQQSPLSY